MTLSSILVSFVVGVAFGPAVHELAVSTGPGDGRRWLPRCHACGDALAPSRWWGGRCPRCGAPRRRRVTAVSAALGVVLAAVPAFGGVAPASLPAYWWFLAATMVFVITDLDHRRIPNRITYPAVAGGVVLLGVAVMVDPGAGSWPRGLVAGLVAFGTFFLLGVAARGGLGMGDVKLMGLVGLFLGFRGWDVLFLGVVFGALAGGIPALVLLLTRKAGRRDELAYGPPLILGAWSALAVGERFLVWYLG